ncbi:MAG TPA: NYN domain-containing protein [Albidovulum sp.]|uniref:NYN domain-containing protein n=1 Tax=Albidovulum sp. TaxID=1872424 RepID=UPI002BEB2E76|nr:NYN domain-containing protein [Albidovulum sp.]
MAVFIDGENISAEHAAAILRIVAASGAADIIRVYGNATALPKWDGQPGFRFIHSGTGKNATDILLTVQAMEAALSDSFATMVIASSDRDFTHLVTRIRELGVTVVGIGEAKAPAQFRAACTRFDVVAAKPVASATPAPPRPEVGALDFKLRDFIKANSKNGEGVPMHRLGPLMHARYGIRISTHPEKTWRAYLLGRPSLFDLDPRGPDAMVRFKPSGFAAQG